MMAMNAMKANEEDFQIASEAEEAVEERKKNTKDKERVIIGANLCKCPRSSMGKAGCSEKQHQEEVTAMHPERDQETSLPEWTEAPSEPQEDADTIGTITTATLFSEVPCCSQCENSFQSINGLRRAVARLQKPMEEKMQRGIPPSLLDAITL